MSVLCPDNGPPRLLRLVSGADFPYPDVVSTLDRKHNLLRVREDWWDNNSKAAQESVLRTEQLCLIEDNLPRVSLLAD